MLIQEEINNLVSVLTESEIKVIKQQLSLFALDQITKNHLILSVNMGYNPYGIIDSIISKILTGTDYLINIHHVMSNDGMQLLYDVILVEIKKFILKNKYELVEKCI